MCKEGIDLTWQIQRNTQMGFALKTYNYNLVHSFLSFFLKGERGKGRIKRGLLHSVSSSI